MCSGYFCGNFMSEKKNNIFNNGKFYFVNLITNQNIWANIVYEKLLCEDNLFKILHMNYCLKYVKII
jgi:hypothetical protein